jgi:hypothetical protein
MKCREARQEMALHLGHDGTEPAHYEEMRRHVSRCPGCRAYYGRLKGALAALEQAGAQAGTYEVRGSLWPELQSRLSQPMPAKKRFGRDHWIPLASVAVACTLFLSVWTGWNPRHHEGQAPASAIGRQTIGGLPDFSSSHPRPSREAQEAEERARAEQLRKLHQDL